MRAAIESLLRSAGLTVRSFGSASEFERRPIVAGPCCLVLDVFLPDICGLELQRQLAHRDPGLPIVFISAHGDIPMTVRAMKAGAVEFLPKPFGAEELLEAVGRALEQARGSHRARMEFVALQRRHDSLTARERAVFERVVAGLLNKQIAFELGISEVTVKIHRRQVMQKMGAASVADLVRMCDRLAEPKPAATTSTMV